jgi:hypothetical protein
VFGRRNRKTGVSDLDLRIAASSRARFGAGVSDEVIRDAEAALGLQFPPSYRWWLGQYGAGYLGGYELQGLAPIRPSLRDPGEQYVGDVVYTALLNRARGIPPHLLEVLDYEGDEVYFLDLSVVSGGESPVVRQMDVAGRLEPVAASFADFLRREL